MEVFLWVAVGVMGMLLMASLSLNVFLLSEPKPGCEPESKAKLKCKVKVAKPGIPIKAKHKRNMSLVQRKIWAGYTPEQRKIRGHAVLLGKEKRKLLNAYKQVQLELFDKGVSHVESK
jgi:hypothetical protein